MKGTVAALALCAASAFAPRPSAVASAPGSARRWALCAEGGGGGEDITESAAFLESKIDVLHQELDNLDTELANAEAQRQSAMAEWGPQIQRLQVEYENVKKRTAEEKSHAMSTEMTHVLEQLFPAIDNLDRAFQYIKPNTESERVIFDKYVEGIEGELANSFEKLGIRPIDEAGVRFDEEFHSAAFLQPHPEIPEEHVSEVLQKGYMFDKIVVRPATVVVSSGEF